jgi:IS1 family transposase
MGWWQGKVRQAFRHVFGRVSDAERRELRGWLSDPQMALFDSMHRADQRHGLDVVAHLRSSGREDPELLLAALLHDCSKGRSVGLSHRVAWSLGERYGERVHRLLAPLPGFRAAFERLRDHAEDSARLARQAGCSERTADLIRHQSAPRDPDAGMALRLADEAS